MVSMLRAKSLDSVGVCDGCGGAGRRGILVTPTSFTLAETVYMP